MRITTIASGLDLDSGWARREKGAESAGVGRAGPEVPLPEGGVS